MKYVIIDLDGTLANVDHRLHFIQREKPDWDAFYAACGKDIVNEWCADLIDAFTYHTPIKIVTARRETERRKTERWLIQNLMDLAPEIIFLRKAGDHTPDVELKEAWLKEFGSENILFVIDDRQRVVDMWRRNGVVCLQCAQWDEYEHKGEDH